MKLFLFNGIPCIYNHSNRLPLSFHAVIIVKVIHIFDKQGNAKKTNDICVNEEGTGDRPIPSSILNIFSVSPGLLTKKMIAYS